MYRFKFYFKDGTSKKSDCYGIRPTILFCDFDGLIDWDEYDKLEEKDMTTDKILKMALKAYENLYPNIYRIEIINDDTEDIIDYIDTREVKNNE